MASSVGTSRSSGGSGAPDRPGAPDRRGAPGAAGPAAGEPVLLDCATCAVRGIGCADCVVALLLGPPEPLAVDGGQVRALAVLARGGLVPPIRHPAAGYGA